MYKFKISDKDTKELIISGGIGLLSEDDREGAKLHLKAGFMLHMSIMFKTEDTELSGDKFLKLLQEDNLIENIINDHTPTSIHKDFDENFTVELSSEEIKVEDEIPNTVEELFNK